MRQAIRLTTGKQVMADVTDWIRDNGQQYSTAADNRGRGYVVVDRDGDGAVWARG